ncbi:lsrG [Symbiodinium natans]|uniref:LsrG protein n=1 Tax=Symbiodinium natans TaxID=878477 RepID=A0A812J7E5_9DINO|nr:lsrG [Symbiodinium natans]
MDEIEKLMELKVTSKKPSSFYTRAAATFLRGTRDKDPVDELWVTALGNAIDSAITVGARMEKDALGKIAAVRTSYLQIDRSFSPQISLRLVRIPPVAVILQVEIKPEHVDEFIQVMKADAAGSREEAGCLRFDFLRHSENPCKFMTYEVFANAEAVSAHGAMPYVKAWGAFQYGDKKPVVSKTVLKADALSFQHQSPASGDNPVAVVFEADVKDDCVTEFVEVMTANARGSRLEAGCLRFDLLRGQEASSGRFVSYEVFESADAVEKHKEMPYTKAWGAFQYGDKKPLTSKTVTKYTALDLQAPELLT